MIMCNSLELRWNLQPAAGILSARRSDVGMPPEARCVFRRDSGSLTFDVPTSETSRWRAVARVLRSPVDAVGCALFPASCVLCGSPLPHLSFVPICAGLLDGVSRSERRSVRVLRRRARRAGSDRPVEQRTVPRLPDGAAAVCARRGLRALRGPHEGGHPRAQI